MANHHGAREESGRWRPQSGRHPKQVELKNKISYK